jgi:hypothetical protein
MSFFELFLSIFEFFFFGNCPKKKKKKKKNRTKKKNADKNVKLRLKWMKIDRKPTGPGSDIGTMGKAAPHMPGTWLLCVFLDFWWVFTYEMWGFFYF